MVYTYGTIFRTSLGSEVCSQNLVLHGAKHSRQVTVPLFSVAGGPVAASRMANYHDIVSIPPVPPSRLDGCSLIDVSYVLVVRSEHSAKLLND